MSKQKSENLYWIELCGFDKSKKDYGVETLLKDIPQAVDGFVFLFANLEFYHEFVLDGDDTLLSINDCVYGGKKRFGNDGALRWTKGQLKGLISVLHRIGKTVFATVFDGIEFPTENPFANANQTIFQLSSDGCGSPVCDLTTNLANGTPYAGFLGQKIREVVDFYGFDGVHFADGISSWRLPLQIGNYAPEKLLKFSEYLQNAGDRYGAKRVQKLAKTPLAIGEKYRVRSEKIWNGYREEWIEFSSKLWAERFALLVAAIPKKVKIIINAAWTRDPFEAKYRYGFDFNLVDFSRVYAYIYNDVNRKITPKEDSCGFYISAEEYKYYENEAPAAMLVTKGALDKFDVPVYSLTPIRDNNENWDVLQSCKQSFVAKLYRRNHLFTARDGYKRIAEGKLYCLSTGVKTDEWACIAKSERNAAFALKKPCGFSFVYSETEQKAEVARYVKEREWSCFRWLKEAQTAGLPVCSVLKIADLEKAESPLICFNVDAFSASEKTQLETFKKQPFVIFAEENPLKRNPNQVIFGGDINCYIYNAKNSSAVSVGEKKTKVFRKRQKEAAAGIWIKNLGYKKRNRTQICKAVRLLNERFGFYNGTGGVMVNAADCGDEIKLLLDNPNAYGVVTTITGGSLSQVKNITATYGEVWKKNDGVCVFVEGQGVNVLTVKK